MHTAVFLDFPVSEFEDPLSQDEIVKTGIVATSEMVLT
jgi:hypothetical protein